MRENTMIILWTMLFIIGLYHDSSEATECTARGRYPNNLRNDCRGYTMCLNVLTNLTRIDIVCPDSSIYSHLDNQCTNVTSYQCLPEHNCTQVGDFPNPYINDCGSYISCVESLGTIVTARLVQCPPDMLFDRFNRTCVNSTSYRCEIPTTVPPNVINATVKYSPGVVLPRNNAYYMNFHVVIFLLFVTFMVIQ